MLWQKPLGLLNRAVETGNQAVSLLSSGKAFPEIVAEQSKLAGDYVATVLETTRTATEITASSQVDYRRWLEQSQPDLSEAVRAAYTRKAA